MSYKYVYTNKNYADTEIEIELEEEQGTIWCYEGQECASITLPMSEIRRLGALFTQFAREANSAIRQGKLTD